MTSPKEEKASLRDLWSTDHDNPETISESINEGRMTQQEKQNGRETERDLPQRACWRKHERGENSRIDIEFEEEKRGTFSKWLWQETPHTSSYFQIYKAINHVCVSYLSHTKRWTHPNFF